MTESALQASSVSTVSQLSASFVTLVECRRQTDIAAPIFDYRHGIDLIVRVGAAHDLDWIGPMQEVLALAA